ncbi:hypothetical protein F0562_012170 [Nyssa sinensis]|uniref:Uncharacterized protein n=1 Tax=Nyssa sinensis TaxID=561372 RepID=A0A5J4ZSV8_9ASTE|nr:hypothetical protein F0562_012170 [Nyssa sinensis]
MAVGGAVERWSKKRAAGRDDGRGASSGGEWLQLLSGAVVCREDDSGDGVELEDFVRDVDDWGCGRLEVKLGGKTI